MIQVSRLGFAGLVSREYGSHNVCAQLLKPENLYLKCLLVQQCWSVARPTASGLRTNSAQLLDDVN